MNVSKRAGVPLRHGAGECARPVRRPAFSFWKSMQAGHAVALPIQGKLRCAHMRVVAMYSSGFSGLPAGNRNNGGGFNNRGNNANFWEASENNASNANNRNLNNSNANLNANNNNKTNGFSVRCLRAWT